MALSEIEISVLGKSNIAELGPRVSAPQAAKRNWSQSAAAFDLLARVPGPMSNSLLALNGALAGAEYLSRPDVSGSDALPIESALFVYGKRAFDILFAVCALLILLPVLLLCALAIRAESSGPVFFRQKRVGKDGRAFSIVKFRTMVPNAEAILQKVLDSDPEAREEWAKDRKLRKDPRVTALGRFLRRSSLDELPQCWNVLAGDMSAVGPRPIVSAEIPSYAHGYRAYCSVRPGITGLWQVSGRNDTGYDQRVALDCRYVRSWSASLDITILYKTIQTVIGAAGAY